MDEATPGRSVGTRTKMDFLCWEDLPADATVVVPKPRIFLSAGNK